MELCSVHFSVSGITAPVFLPPLVSFVISVFTSMCGLSGAFLLLPFQMSYLGFTSPAVSSTNLLYNVIAIPSGAFQFARKKRMVWPLAWVIIAGTLPGVFLGYYIRVLLLPDPTSFKLFVGCVLLYTGSRLLLEAKPPLLHGQEDSTGIGLDVRALPSAGSPCEAGTILPKDIFGQANHTASSRFLKLEYKYEGQAYSFSGAGMLILSLLAGVIGGAYGIGGAAMIAPFCVVIFRLPIHTIAGAALVGAFFTSIVGVLFYSLLPNVGVACAPDWKLGLCLGIGGFAGTYCGARLQKSVSPAFLKKMLGIIICAMACQYILNFFLKVEF